MSTGPIHITIKVITIQNGDYFQWHADQCALMKSWPDMALAIGRLREAAVKFSIACMNTGNAASEWDKRLDPVYRLLSDIRRETGCWIEDSLK